MGAYYALLALTYLSIPGYYILTPIQWAVNDEALAECLSTLSGSKQETCLGQVRGLVNGAVVSILTALCLFLLAFNIYLIHFR